MWDELRRLIATMFMGWAQAIHHGETVHLSRQIAKLADDPMNSMVVFDHVKREVRVERTKTGTFTP